MLPKWGASNLLLTLLVVPGSPQGSQLEEVKSGASGTASEDRTRKLSPQKLPAPATAGTERHQCGWAETPRGFRVNPLREHERHASTRQGRVSHQHLQGSVCSGTDRSGERQLRRTSTAEGAGRQEAAAGRV